MEPSIIHSNFPSVFFILRSCYYCGTAEYYPIPNSLSGIGLHHSAWPRTILFHGSSLIKLDPWVSSCGPSASVTFHHPLVTIERAPIWVKDLFLEAEKCTIGLPTLNTSFIISSLLLWYLNPLSSPWWIVAQELKTFRRSLAQHLRLSLLFVGTLTPAQHICIFFATFVFTWLRQTPTICFLSFIPS